MSFSYSDTEPIIREKLAMGGTVRIKPQGTSMLPAIRPGRDEITLKKPVFPLKRYDIPFCRAPGGFVLHRVIEVKKDGYIICGDNLHRLEHITEDMVIAVVAAIVRDGREEIPCTDPEYLKFTKKYCARRALIRRFVLPVRRMGGKILRPLRRLLKKLH